MNREPWLHSCVPSSGSVFIDVGANAGEWTRWLAPRYEWVHAIEPNPAVLGRLKMDLPENVTVHECAAWSSDGSLKFARYFCPDHFSGYFYQPFLGVTGPVAGVVTVATKRIDTMDIHGSVDFIKIDTEGGEFEVVSGALTTIENHGPKILIEIHANANFHRIINLLEPLKYATSVIRHPEFSMDHKLFDEHFWLDCRPNR